MRLRQSSPWTAPAARSWRPIRWWAARKCAGVCLVNVLRRQTYRLPVRGTPGWTYQVVSSVGACGFSSRHLSPFLRRRRRRLLPGAIRHGQRRASVLVSVDRASATCERIGATPRAECLRFALSEPERFAPWSTAKRRAAAPRKFDGARCKSVCESFANAAKTGRRVGRSAQAQQGTHANARCRRLAALR